MLEGILKETYGVIINQEQVMQIAQVMAGYSLGQADLLRRAMGKKDKTEMAKQQALFVEGAMRNGVAKDDAAYIFELVDKFAGYGFNKSHAAAYALVSYHTAYLKANFREEFFAASMTLDQGNTDKLAMFAGEVRRSGIEIKPPCVNASEVDFLAEPPKGGAKHGAIRYSLAALKNIGAAAVETVVKEREAGGAYASLADFAARLNSKALNKRALETLAAAGSFDTLEANRAAVHANADVIMAHANRLKADKEMGTADLFGGGGAGGGLDLRATPAWTPMERLANEFNAVGFYLSGHPLDEYQSVLPKIGAMPLVDFLAKAERGVTIGKLAGIVISARERKSQKGNKFAFAQFSDATGSFEAIVFSDTLNVARDLLEAGTAVLVSVEAERDGDTVKFRTLSIEALDKVVSSVQRGLKIIVDQRALQVRPTTFAELKRVLRPGGKGEIRIALEIGERGKAVEFQIPGRFDVSPSQKGIISTVAGVMDVVEI
jgi:DNA polymerase-3 subunit alpha